MHWDKAVVARFIETNSEFVSRAIKIACRSENPSIDFILSRMMEGEPLSCLCEEMNLNYPVAAAAIWRSIGVHVSDLHNLASSCWRRDAIERVVNGATLSQVAADYGVSKQSVSVWLRDAGLPEAPSLVLKKKRRAMVVEKLSEGKTVREIARDMDISIAVVNADIRKMGIPVQKKKGRSFSEKTCRLLILAKDDIHSGLSISELAVKYGISYNSALLLCKYEGRDTRKGAYRHEQIAA